MKLQQELLIEGVLDRSPKDEFEQSKKSGELVFYGVGSSTYGVTFYGLSEEEVARWIKDAGIDFKIEFIDDPSPAFVTEAYWEAVVEFATKYNQLLLSYLRGSSKEE